MQGRVCRRLLVQETRGVPLLQRDARAGDSAALKPESVRRPAKVAWILALAHHMLRAVDCGLTADRAASARKLS